MIIYDYFYFVCRSDKYAWDNFKLRLAIDLSSRSRIGLTLLTSRKLVSEPACAKPNWIARAGRAWLLLYFKLSMFSLFLLKPSNTVIELVALDANMTTNRVISFKNLDTVARAGKQLLLDAAIKTELWNRPELTITSASTEGFKKAVVESTQELPAVTAKVVWRWVAHSQKSHGCS